MSTSKVVNRNVLPAKEIKGFSYRVVMVVSSFPVISEAFILNQIKFLIDSGCDVRILAAQGVERNAVNHNIVEEYGLLNKLSSMRWSDYMPGNYIRRLFDAVFVLWKYRKSPLFFSLLKSLNFFKYGIQSIRLVKFYKTLMASFFLENDFDVVHVHFVNNMIDIYPLFEVLEQRVKVVGTFHGYDAFLFSKENYSAFMDKTDIQYTVNTSYLKKQVERLLFDPEQIKILPVGLDTKTFSPKNNTEDELEIFRIIFVGRLIALKAPLLAIKIAHQLYNEKGNVHLTIIGDGPEYKECQKYIRRFSLESVVDLKGGLSQKEVQKELSSSDVFLFPGIVDEDGRAEAQGLVIQEAQAMELPVIVSDVGGMKDGLIDGKTGYVVPEKNITAFVSKLSYLQDNPIKKREMGKEARRFVVGNYDNEILGQKLLAIYAS